MTADYMNIVEWAENRVPELVEEIKFYVAEGISKDRAIEIVKKQTTIGEKYWNMVLEQTA